MSSFLSSLTVNQVNFNDYEVQQPHLQEGGWGKVYSAKEKRNNNNYVAMKFFGYTKQQPILSEIMKEINLMKSLVGVDGVVQLIGTFDDRPEGYSKLFYFLLFYLFVILFVCFVLYFHFIFIFFLILFFISLSFLMN